MAKKRKGSTPRSRREVSSFANQRLPTSLSVQSAQLDLIDFLRSIEDRRTYDPSGHVSARSFTTPHHTLVPATTHHPYTNKKTIPSGVAFKHPEEVLVCVRRKQRKEVLHAFNKTGKSGQRRPRRSRFSDVHC